MRLVFHGASRQEGRADLRAGRAWTKEKESGSCNERGSPTRVSGMVGHLQPHLADGDSAVRPLVRSTAWIGMDDANIHIGCRQPKMKHRIRAPATEGANGMRFLSPTCWTCAHPKVAATTCSA